MTRRGVLYIIWGSRADHVLERSRQSLARHHPELPIEVVRIETTDPVQGLLEKSRMMRLSPFEETLFLDADTVVLGRLDFGFAKAERFGIACAICECPWARRYRESIKGDAVEYNTGVLFFTPKSVPLFDAWERLAAQIDSSILFVHDQKLARMPYNDQCSFAAAVEETGVLPFVLPLNWNFRPQWHRSFFGPLKIWHDYSDPPAQLAEISKYYEDSDAIIQFHG